MPKNWKMPPRHKAPEPKVCGIRYCRSCSLKQSRLPRSHMLTSASHFWRFCHSFCWGRRHWDQALQWVVNKQREGGRNQYVHVVRTAPHGLSALVSQLCSPYTRYCAWPHQRCSTSPHFSLGFKVFRARQECSHAFSLSLLSCPRKDLRTW